jgi:hypothetical protein
MVAVRANAQTSPVSTSGRGSSRFLSGLIVEIGYSVAQSLKSFRVKVKLGASPVRKRPEVASDADDLAARQPVFVVPCGDHPPRALPLR